MIRQRAVVVVVALVWLAALALMVKSSVDRLSAPPWGNVVEGDLSPGMAGSTRVGQTWRAPLPGLYRIEVWLQPPRLGDSRPLTFHLRAGVDAASDLWTATVDPAQVAAGSPYAIDFGPLRDSKDRTFYFFLESPQSQPGEAVRVVYGPKATLSDGSAYVDGREVAGDLVFQTYYTLRTREKVDLLLERMAEGRPYLLGTKGFYVGLAVVNALLLLLLTWQVARQIGSPGK